MSLRYHQPLFRPPSEASSLIVQVTWGCSHNRCTFCSMYRSKTFTVVPLAEVQAAVAEARAVLGPDVQRVFLADGDALCLSVRRLLPILQTLNEAFPQLQRISCYANARDVLQKSDAELEVLRQHKLRLLYLGLESGDEQTLERVAKGATVDELVLAAVRARQAEMRTSVMVLVGLAGRERSLIHAQRSAEAINRMEPTYTALLTYMPTPGSPLGDAVSRGELELPDARGTLEEIRTFLEHLECQTAFSCNHASNYLPLSGRLPSAKDSLLIRIDEALAGKAPLKPEAWRGL